MKRFLRLVALSALFLCCMAARKSSPTSAKRVVCYYTNWSVYRPGTAKFSPQNINPYLCTHLIYAFGGLSRENGLRPFDKYQDIEQGGYAKFTGLKTYNKDLKTMLAIGGWNEGSTRFSPLVADPERRKEFVRNVLRFLRQNHFDGLDLDWEYPAFRDGGKPRDKANYALLVKELREEFDRESEKTGRPRLLLTMAVPAGIEYIDKGFDIPTLNKYLDFMNILSYDYHSAFEPAVNHHSPLYSLEEDDEYNFDAQLTIDHTVNHYMKLGADRSKLVLGIPTYGRSYTLFNPLATELGAPADGPGEQGDSTREKGYLAYYEICENLHSDDWKVEKPNPKAMGPYAYKGNQWVSYDDMDIVKKKALYVNDNGLGGIMFWAIDNDDFRGKCHGRPYPLIEAGKEAMLKGVKRSSNEVERAPSPRDQSPPSRKRNRPGNKRGSGRGRTSSSTTTTTTTTTTSTTTPASPLNTPEPPTTPDPGSDFKCVDEGFFPHPRDCKKYFWCLDSGPSNLGIVAHQFTCPSGLFFNKAADSCDYARNVVCNKKAKAPSGGSSTLPPIKAATSSTTRFNTPSSTTSTTTTTEAPVKEEEEDEEEYDDYEDEEGSQEDPQALKELINLIKKLGGVEQLEKQLNLQSSEQNSNSKDSVTTPAVSRTLYNRLVSYNTARNLGSSGPTTTRYTSLFQNRPEKPQNAGLEDNEEVKALRREKPTYVNIRRERPSIRAPPLEESNEEDSKKILSSSIEQDGELSDEEEYVDEDEIPEPKVEIKTPHKEYITIQRSRPITTSEDDLGRAVFQESASTVPEILPPQESRSTTVSYQESNSPRYVTISRVRPTVEPNIISAGDGSNTNTEFRSDVNYRTITDAEDETKPSLRGTTPSTLSSTLQTEDYTSKQKQERHRFLAKEGNVLTVSSSPIYETIDDAIIENQQMKSKTATASSITEDYNQDSTTKSLRQFRQKLETTSVSPDIYADTTTIKIKTRPNTERRRFRPKTEATTTESEEAEVPDSLRRFRPNTDVPAESEVTEKVRRFRPKAGTTTESGSTEPKRRFRIKIDTETESNVTEQPRRLRLTTTPTEKDTQVTEKSRRFRPKVETTNQRETSKLQITEQNEDEIPSSSLRTLSEGKATTLPERAETKLSKSATSEVTQLPVPELTERDREVTSSAVTNSPLSESEPITSSIFNTTPLSGTTKLIFSVNSNEQNIKNLDVNINESQAKTDLNSFVTTSQITQYKTQTVTPTGGAVTLRLQDSLPESTLRTTDETTKAKDLSTLEIEPVLSTSQQLLYSGIAEVTSSQILSTTESLEQQSVSTDAITDNGSTTTVKFPETSRTTVLPSTRTAARHRGTPKVVRRRKFGPGSQNSTASPALEAGTRSRKFNFPRKRVLVNSTADRDMDLLESMDHLARDKPGQDNLLLSTQDSFAQSQSLQKATTTSGTRKGTRLPNERPTLPSRRGTFSTLPSTQLQPGSVTVHPETTDTDIIDGLLDHIPDQVSTVQPSSSPFLGRTSEDQRYQTSVSGPTAIFPQESGIIYPSTDLSFPHHKTSGGDLEEISFDTFSVTQEGSLKGTTKSLEAADVTEVTLGAGRIPSTTQSSTNTARSDVSGERKRVTQLTPTKPRTDIFHRTRNRLLNKQPIQSEENISSEPKRTTVIVPNRGSTIEVPTTVHNRNSSRSRGKPFSKVSRTKSPVTQRTSTKAAFDYEYYDDDESAILDVGPLSEKVKIHSDGYIECLDQGNFPHPFSCKKFISCAKMENGDLLGWEYTCPRQLSFDPIGGICNWSAGLGCKE